MANQGDFHWINRRQNQWEDQWEHPYKDEFNNAIRNMRDGVLNISSTRLTKLPRLLEGVKILICYNSPLKQITEPLPQSLQEYDYPY
jgi:hypothetical protein